VNSDGVEHDLRPLPASDYTMTAHPICHGDAAWVPVTIGQGPARYLKEHSPDVESVAAADDPTQVTKRHVEAFQGWVIETWSASTALNKHKGLQQFFKWLVVEEEEELDRSPMDRVGQPKTPEKLIPVLSVDDTKEVLDLCKGKTFANLRDQAIIRLLCNTGARLSEVGDLTLGDIDLATESVPLRGKRAKDRRVRFGPNTARALSRYVRARQPTGSRAAASVAGRSRRPPSCSERHLDHAAPPGGESWHRTPARPPLAAQLRPRVETGRPPTPASSCSYLAGHPTRCPGITAALPPPSEHWRPNSGSASASASNRPVGSQSCAPCGAHLRRDFRARFAAATPGACPSSKTTYAAGCAEAIGTARGVKYERTH
jgi:hypothetical protein